MLSNVHSVSFEAVCPHGFVVTWTATRRFLDFEADIYERPPRIVPDCGVHS